MDDELDTQEGEPEVIDAPVDSAPEPQNAPADTIEDIAASIGWSPQEKWRGNPEDWKPASEFLRHTADVNQGLKKTIRTVEDRLERISRTTAQITEAAVEKARREAEERFNQAVEMGDTEAARAATRDLNAMPVTASEPPETTEFRSRHAKWFGVDQEATTYAVRRAQKYADEGLSVARQLSMVERDMKQTFPDLFEAPTPSAKPPAAVAAPGARTAVQRTKGYNDLPPAEKAAAQDFAKRGRCTLEEFAKIYFEESGQ